MRRRWAAAEVLEGNTRWCIGWLVQPMAHPVPYYYLCIAALGLLLMLGGLLLQRVTLGSPLYEISASPEYRRACGIANAEPRRSTEIHVLSGSRRVTILSKRSEKTEQLRQGVARIEHEKAFLESRDLPAEWIYLGSIGSVASCSSSISPSWQLV